MAVIANQFKSSDQEDPQQGQQGQQAPLAPSVSQPVNVSGASANPNASAGQAQNSANPQSTSSGRFSNLTSYIKANSDYNKDGGGFGGQISQDLQNKGNDVTNTLQNANTTFNKDADSGHITYDPTVTKAALDDPTGYTAKPENLDKFTKQRDATYKGPTDLDTNQQIAGNVNDYRNLTNLTQSEGGVPGAPGRFEMLRSLYGQNNGYTAGQQQLDNLFLQADPKQLSQVQQASAMGNTLANQYHTTRNQDQITAQNYAADADSARQQTADALNSALAAEKSNIDKGYNDFITQQGQSQSDLASQLSDRNGLIAYATAHGIDPSLFNVSNQDFLNNPQVIDALTNPSSPNNGGSFYNNVSDFASLLNMGNPHPGIMSNIQLDGSKFITPGQKLNEQQFVNPAEYSKLAALSKLSGNVVNNDAKDFLTNYADPTQSADINDPTYKASFDSSGFQNTLQSAKQAALAHMVSNFLYDQNPNNRPNARPFTDIS